MERREVDGRWCFGGDRSATFMADPSALLRYTVTGEVRGGNWSECQLRYSWPVPGIDLLLLGFIVPGEWIWSGFSFYEKRATWLAAG